MKIRNGFVSNSSSSSFICDVCGHDVSECDLSLSETEMYECENGHVFCEEHALEIDNVKELAKDLVNMVIEQNKQNIKIFGDDNNYYLNKIKKEEEFLEKLNDDEFEIDMYELEEEYELRYNFPSKYCPICQMQVVKNDDMVSYLLKKHGVTSKDVKEEMKQKFSSYEDLKKYTNE